MQTKDRRFAAVDVLLLIMTVLPLVSAIVLKVLLIPPSEGIDITGAYVFFTLPTPIQSLPITESQVNSWMVVLSILFLALWLTHGIRAGKKTRRQVIAEWIVEKTEDLVKGNMGGIFLGFAPFIAAILALSAFSSLTSLLGLFPPTSDLNVVGGWAILVFFLITWYKLKCGVGYYLKSFCEPVAFFAPINLVSELATPVAMSFRHYGNVLSGIVISVLVTAGLSGLSEMVLGWLPGILGDIPFLRIGLPAILSVYFDLFSGCLQAFIFAMLTMLYVAGGFSPEDYQKRKDKAAARRARRSA